jgi:hypothetical protein
LGREQREASIGDAPVRFDVDAVFETAIGRERRRVQEHARRKRACDPDGIGSLQSATRGPSDLVIDIDADLGPAAKEFQAFLPETLGVTAGKLRTRWVTKGDAAAAGLSGTLTIDGFEGSIRRATGERVVVREPRASRRPRRPRWISARESRTFVDGRSRRRASRSKETVASPPTVTGFSRRGTSTRHACSQAIPMVLPKGYGVDARVYSSSMSNRPRALFPRRAGRRPPDLVDDDDIRGGVPRVFADPSVACDFDVAATYGTNVVPTMTVKS